MARPWIKGAWLWTGPAARLAIRNRGTKLTLLAAVLSLSVVAAAAAAQADPAGRLAGVWEGRISVAGQSIRIIFRVGADGRAVMDSPDQGAHGIAAEAELVGDQAAFRIPTVQGRVSGALSADGRTIAATLSQSGAALPILLTRTAQTAAFAARPQTPQPPFPYRVVETAFDNPAAPGVRLAGSLTLPEGSGPFPAAILVSGTGPQDRDETIEGHKPFAIWADALTRRGVAVLRYDDRGVAASTGDFAAATQRDFASDAKAALQWLAARPDIDGSRIGFIGHSEGAIFAELAIQDGAAAAWLATLAGPAVPGGEILVEQVRSLALAAGRSPEEAEASADAQRRLMEAVKQNAEDPAAARRELEMRLLELGQAPQEAARNAQAMSGPWYRGMVAHDPSEAIRGIEVPMLAVFGGKDVQVPPEQNAPATARLKPDAEVVVLPGLNHLLQPAQTGSPSEYGQIETSLDASAVSTVVDWVAARSGL